MTDKTAYAGALEELEETERLFNGTDALMDGQYMPTVMKALRLADALERGPSWTMQENGKFSVNGEVSTNKCAIIFETMIAQMKKEIGDE